MNEVTWMRYCTVTDKMTNEVVSCSNRIITEAEMLQTSEYDTQIAKRVQILTEGDVIMMIRYERMI